MASAYLRVVLDSIFKPVNFRNEIIWKRTSGHSDARKYGRVHDVLLYYAKGPNPTWNQIHQPYDPAYVEQYYRYQDTDGRHWMSGDAGAAGLQGEGMSTCGTALGASGACPRKRWSAWTLRAESSIPETASPA